MRQKFPTCDHLLFGGSFDPPHAGHLSMLEFIVKNHLANQIHVTPAKVSPFKIDKPPANAKHRIAMVQMMIDHVQKRITNSDVNIILDKRELEVRQLSSGYTYDTLQSLQDEFLAQMIALALGKDSMIDFKRWHNAEDILSNFKIYLFDRGGISTLKDESLLSHKNIIVLNHLPPACSSTDIRHSIASLTKPLAGLLLPEVEEYIRSNALYS